MKNSNVKGHSSTEVTISIYKKYFWNPQIRVGVNLNDQPSSVEHENLDAILLTHLLGTKTKAAAIRVFPKKKSPTVRQGILELVSMVQGRMETRSGFA